MLNTNNFQELFLQLHVSGLYRQSELELHPRKAITEFGPPRDTRGEPGILGRPQPPTYLYLALVIPRSKLRVFTKDSPVETGTPGLHISVHNTTLFENSFYAIDAFFGKLTVDKSSDTATVEEDSLTWRGTSDMIVTCLVPTAPFMIGARHETRVALVVNSSVLTTRYVS